MREKTKRELHECYLFFRLFCMRVWIFMTSRQSEFSIFEKRIRTRVSLGICHFSRLVKHIYKQHCLNHCLKYRQSDTRGR